MKVFWGLGKFLTLLFWVGHRMSASFREFLVVGIFTDTVGMPADAQLRTRGLFFQAGGNHVELGFVGSRELRGVELEVHVTNHDGFFLDHHHFLLNHRYRHRRAAIGVDLHAFWRAWALVAAVRYAIAVLVTVAMHPAIGASHAANHRQSSKILTSGP